MARFGKYAKYTAIGAVIVIIAAAGTYIEQHEGDAFIVETSTVSEDRFIPAGEGVNSEGKININTASAEELAALDGIGEVISERIADFREENGPFLTVEGIMLVDGVGDKLFEDIKDFIYVE